MENANFGQIVSFLLSIANDCLVDVYDVGDYRTNILKEFHDIFGDIEWTDEDKVKKQVADLPEIVSRDEAYQNAMQNSDAQNARTESDRATNVAILATMSSGIKFYKAVQGNESFRKWIMDMVFNATYSAPVAARKGKATTYSATESPVLKVAEATVPYGRKEGV